MSIGVEVNTRTAPPADGATSLTDTLFLAWDGEGGSGSLTEPILCRSLADFVAAYGARASANQEAYDYLDGYFREGGRRAYTARHTTAGTVDAALALFTADLGPGQIAVSGGTPGATLWGKMRTHAINNNRFALYDGSVDSDTEAELDALGDVLIADDEYGMFAGQWANIPGPAGVIGASSRQIPGSAATAALIARADALGNPNRAAAGRDFPLQYVDSFVYLPSDADRVALLNNGINLFADKQNILQLYGFQTKLQQTDESPFWQANCSRARMYLKARCQARGEPFMFKPIDGRGRLQARLKTALDQECLALYNVDGLYGATPQDAFATQVGASVNNESTIAQGELHAVAEARFSLHTKRVLIDLVSVPITGRVSTGA
jgi:hypothetical protein